MKLGLLVAFFTAVNTQICLSQGTGQTGKQTERIQETLDSLQQKKSTLIQALTKLESTIDSVNVLKIEAEIAESAELYVSAKYPNSFLKELPSVESNRIAEGIPKDAKIRVFGFETGYWKAIYDGVFGYLPDEYVVQNEFVKAIAEKFTIPADSKEESSNVLSTKTAKSNDLVNPLRWVKVLDLTVYESPDFQAGIVEILRWHYTHSVELLDETGSWAKIKYSSRSDWKDREGWVPAQHITAEKLGELHSNDILKIRGDIQTKHRRDSFVGSHPSLSLKFKNAILDGQVVLGMTEDMVTASWGAPDDINRTVTTLMVHEQWVYGQVYLYFDDGILTAFQD